jgi:hypothetical protein
MAAELEFKSQGEQSSAWQLALLVLLSCVMFCIIQHVPDMLSAS